MIETNRRSLLTGLISFAACAPAIVRAGSLMPVKTMIEPVIYGWDLGSKDMTAMITYIVNSVEPVDLRLLNIGDVITWRR